MDVGNQMSEVIKLSGVSVIRNKIKILDNINWTVNPGENWAVIGRNGAGKSFLLNVIAGNIFPSQGKVTVLDRTFGETDMLELRRLIGYVSPAFQYNYDGATSVNKVVYSGFFASNGLYYDPTQQMIDKTADILRRMGLSHLADKPFGLLSSGFVGLDTAVAKTETPMLRIISAVRTTDNSFFFMHIMTFTSFHRMVLFIENPRSTGTYR